jgi:hypothetical protein
MGARIHRWNQIHGVAWREGLGSDVRCPSDPRRNTSKPCFESLAHRNKAATRCLFVAVIRADPAGNGNKVATARGFDPVHTGTVPRVRTCQLSQIGRV